MQQRVRARPRHHSEPRNQRICFISDVRSARGTVDLRAHEMHARMTACAAKIRSSCRKSADPCTRSATLCSRSYCSPSGRRPAWSAECARPAACACLVTWTRWSGNTLLDDDIRTCSSFLRARRGLLPLFPPRRSLSGFHIRSRRTCLGSCSTRVVVGFARARRETVACLQSLRRPGGRASGTQAPSISERTRCMLG